MTRRTPTDAQRAIKLGQQVLVLLDNGAMVYGRCIAEPYEMGGHTWVLHTTATRGAYLLTRCHPLPAELDALVSLVRSKLEASRSQGGDPGFTGDGNVGDARWAFVASPLFAMTPADMDTLYAGAGMQPKMIPRKGDCGGCVWGLQTGPTGAHERGYDVPCTRCERPSMSEFRPGKCHRRDTDPGNCKGGLFAAVGSYVCQHHAFDLMPEHLRTIRVHTWLQDHGRSLSRIRDGQPPTIQWLQEQVQALVHRDEQRRKLQEGGA